MTKTEAIARAVYGADEFALALTDQQNGMLKSARMIERQLKAYGFQISVERDK